MSFNPWFFNDSPLPLDVIYRLTIEFEKLDNKQTELEKIVKELINTVDDIVAEKLQQMYDDGTLKELLESITTEKFEEMQQYFENVLSKQNEIINFDDKAFSNINTHRLWRYIYSIGMREKESETNAPRFSQTQGGCSFIHNNQKMYAYITIPLNVENTNLGVLTIADYDTGEIISQIGEEAGFIVGHGNSMCYLNGSLYIMETTEYDAEIGELVSSDTVIKVDIDTQNVQYYPLNVDLTYRLIGIDTDNNDLYFNNTRGDIYKIEDLSYGIVSFVARIPAELRGVYLQYTSQDFAIDKDYYYFLTVSPSLLIRVSKTNFNKYWIYDFNPIADKLHYTGEIENLTVYDDGTTDFGCFCRLQSFTYFSWGMTQLLTTNIRNNYFIREYEMQYQPEQHISLYVDKNIATTRIGNPDGTEANPCRYLQEAINIAMACPCQSATIYVKTGDTIFNTIHGNKSIIIQADTSIFSTTNKCRAGGFYIRNAQVKMNLLAVGCSNTNKSGSDYLINGCVTVANSQLNFADCHFDNTSSTASLRPTTYGCVNNGGFISGRGDQTSDIVFNSSGGFVNYHN